MTDKKTFYIALGWVLLVSFASCSLGKIEGDKALSCVESYLAAVKSNQKEEALKYYSSSYDESGSPEKRLEKMQKLEEVMGPITTYTFQDSSRVTDGDFDGMSFTYKVAHTRVTTIEKFIIIKDAGEYKISSHDIKSENLN